MGGISRREWLKAAGTSCLLAESGFLSAASAKEDERYAIVGQKQAAVAGMGVLAEGGNAVDAIVSAALVASVVVPHSCGIGGYGGHAVIATPNGKITAIDFNSTAPAAAREDMFRLDDRGQVRDEVNTYGWLAPGVPGTLAGLQRIRDKWGTRPLSALVQPAIRVAQEGFAVTPLFLAKLVGEAASRPAQDPGAAKLLFPGGQAPAEGQILRNPDLAEMLKTLADRNSVHSFYRGDIAQQIAAEFERHGGLVTAADLASYRAREVAPLSFAWDDYVMFTPPLTSGGLSVLQALGTLKTLGWESWPQDEPRTIHARIEAMRIAWHDRLTLLGDPEATRVPVGRLLSPEYAEQSAARVRRAVDARKMVASETDGRRANGTVHLTACDRDGMMVSMTFSHGGAFGACVAVEGLGLILGHGVSRFDPRPGMPNSIRPGRRPLHNMCPSVICRQGRPVIALGATGGRRIPNTIMDVLVELLCRGQSLPAAVAAPRIHTEGGSELELSATTPQADRKYLQQIGYQVSDGLGAIANGITREAVTGRLTMVPPEDR